MEAALAAQSATGVISATPSEPSRCMNSGSPSCGPRVRAGAARSRAGGDTGAPRRTAVPSGQLPRSPRDRLSLDRVLARRGLERSEEAVRIAEEHGWMEDRIVAPGVGRGGDGAALARAVRRGRAVACAGAARDAARRRARHGVARPSGPRRPPAGAGPAEEALACFREAERMQTLLRRRARASPWQPRRGCFRRRRWHG